MTKDIFRRYLALWGPLIEQCRESLDNDRYVASFSVADPKGVNQRTIGEMRREQMVSRDNLAGRIRQLASDLTRQVEAVGNKKLIHAKERAMAFAMETHDRVKGMLQAGDDPVYDVDESTVPDCMTVAELGELATLNEKLSILGRNLNPPAKVGVGLVPPGSLPVLTMDRELLDIQQKATRVSGSDMGDSSLACLCMYADATEVDKRTHEYVARICRRGSPLKTVIGPVFKTTDQARILDRVREALA